MAGGPFFAQNLFCPQSDELRKSIDCWFLEEYYKSEDDEMQEKCMTENELCHGPRKIRIACPIEDSVSRE